MSGFSDSAFSAAPMSTPVAVDASAALSGVFGTGRVGSIAVAADANIIPTGVSGTGATGKIFLWFPIDPNQNPYWTDVINSP